MSERGNVTGDARISFEEITVIKGEQRLSDARFGADGRSVVTKSEAGFERWNAETGETLGAPPPHDPDVAAFAEAAKRRFVGDALDARAADAVGRHFNGWADLATVSPNGLLVAVGSNSGYLGVVDLERDAPLILWGHSTTINNHMHQNSINAMIFDSSSTYLISVAEEDCNPLLWDLSEEGEPKVWNNKPGRRLDRPVRINDFTPVRSDSFHFSPNEPKFVTTHGATGTAHVWEIVRTPRLQKG